MTEPQDTNTPSPNSQQSNESSPGKTTETEKNVRKNLIADIWKNTTTGIEQVKKTAIGWLTVPESEVATILEQVRAELPTTEALLIGKPQAGKSSIVRGLTGVSAEIIGQGFRPHTQHTERYAYPSDDLPLLIFTDTVGLGDVNQETEKIIAELVGDLKIENNRARVLIWTVKINDFATDTLKTIATQLRQEYPHLPCLLVVTCLHEIYPPEVEDHPDYPPDFEAVNRAFEAIEEGFKGLCDRAVMIDFTLEEDGYNPVFYGLEAFRDTLADLLPEAEARTIHQLLDEQASQQLGNLYRDVGRRYILAFTVITATVAAVPLPFATMPVLTTLQVSMVGLLGQLYGQTLNPSQAGGVVSAIAGGFLAQAVGRELVKFIPGFGSVIAASWAAAYTWALGEGACVYFGDLMGGKKPDPQKIQSVMNEAFKEAKERFKGIQS
ncbi:50S ribosome-binding GTPase family protein [Lyngbya aestuarii BL J]|uniref:50S ribosome-binding GTPase family protein n=1 Tax=Lyngbya aestuarii BL J TaxID=1348334 RepID=U7QDV3_9CYAN|nr:50S ribosome-binding GTPase [Lyngbya aestuarii]ERT06023.1 50S ribosome-binding GTPase family protein [Lyngbya aestuarii BL J]